MRFAAKSYLAFTSFRYRLLMFLLVPTGAFAGTLAYGELLGSSLQQSGLLLFMFVWSYAETFSDYWLFSGIASAKTHGSEMLRTSERGMAMMRSGLIMDQVRRLVYMAAGTAVLIIAGQNGVPDFPEFLEFVLFYYTWTTGMVWISRFLSSYTGIRILTAYSAGMGVAGGVILTVINMGQEPGIAAIRAGIICVFALLAVLVSVCSVLHVMKRVKGGYYDSKN